MLKVKFWRIDNVVLMKVLEQGNEIKRGSFKFKASNGIEIKSVNEPQIYYSSDVIFVRGLYTKEDSSVTVCEYDSIKQAKERLKKFQDAIKEYNNSEKNTDKKSELEIVIVG